MARWIIALSVSSVITLRATSAWRHWAYRSGWFERSTQTARRRSQRRPTHGGLVLALAVAVGSLLAGPSEPVTQAIGLAAVVAVVGGRPIDRGAISRGHLRAGSFAAILALPACGIRTELTGTLAIDLALTMLLGAVVIQGLRSIGRTDGLVPLVVGLAAAALLMIAVRSGDPVAPAAAAVLGAAGAMLAKTWPPATVRIGAVGSAVLGVALTAVAVELLPDMPRPRDVLVPALLLLVAAAAAVVPRWDQRLARRGMAPALALGTAAAAGAVAAERLAAGALAAWAATALATGPVVALGLLAARGPAPGAARAGSRRRRVLTAAALGALLLVVTGAAATALLDARRSMVAGRDAATAGLDAARAGDLDRAQAQFEVADAAFGAARHRLDNPVVRLGGVLPGVAQNLHSARTLAAVGSDLSSTAVAVAERAGADDLLVVDGRFPIDAARPVSQELGAAVATLRSASERLAGTDSPWLLGEVRAGSDDVALRVAEATDSIEVVAEATRLAPALLGADGDRRWMVAVLTPSEQRGAGGLAGDYAELRTADGDIELVRTLPAAELNASTDRSAQLAALPEIYRQRYEGFRVGRFWQNLSATPDVPTFGEAIAGAFPLTPGGGPVDGVIAIDPYGIAALLEITGPISVPPWAVPLTADNAARALLFTQYNWMPAEALATFQGDVIRAVVDALTTGTLPPISEIARALGPQVAAGHLRLWSAEPDAEALFSQVGAAGSLGARPDGSDFVELVTQNAGENKIDWYLRRSLAYAPTFDPATGALTATATVTLTNTIPADFISYRSPRGWSKRITSYIKGETGGPTKPGESALRLTIYSPHAPVGVTDADGRSLPVNIGREKGLYAVTVLVELPPQAQATVRFELAGTLPPSSGSYHLQVGRQPAVAPDAVRVTMVGGPGWVLSDPADSVRDLPAETDVTFETRLERR